MAEADVGLRASLKDRASTAAGLKSIKGDVDSVGRSARTTGRLASASSRGFDVMRKAGKLAAAAVKVGFVAALGAGYAVVKLLRASFVEARESQKVGARTNNVIKTTGGVANITAKQVGKLSTAISKKAGIDDEAIQTGANLLLTFKNIRNEAGKGNDIFNQTTQAAVDLSAAGFGSLDSASKMLGKALNDPVKGLTAMGRAGVTFSASQTDQIKKMVDQNNLLGAQKIILGEVKSQVGGAAAAQATWGDKAKVTFSNIEESLGKSLLPLLDDVERWFVKKGAPDLQHYLRVFRRDGVPAIKDFEKKLVPLATQTLPKVETVLGLVAHDLKVAAPYAKKMIDAFLGAPKWVQEALVGGGIAAFAAKKTGLTGPLGALLKLGGSRGSALVSKGSPVPVFVTNQGFGGGAGVGGAAAGGSLAGDAERAAPVVGGTLTGFLTKGGLTGLSRFLPILPALGTQTIDPGPIGTAKQFQAEMNQLKAVDPLATIASSAQKADLSNLLLKPLDDATSHAKTLGSSLTTVGHIRVAPDVSTPGLPKAQSGVDTLDNTLTKISRQPFNAHVNADTRQAMGLLTQLQNYTFRDKYIHVHTVQGGTNAGGGGDLPAAHGGAPQRTAAANPRGTGHLSAGDLAALDGADSRAATPPIHVHVNVDRKQLAEAVIGGVADKAARQ